MKVDFEDGSFLVIDASNNADRPINLTVCGIKNNKTIMSISHLSVKETQEIISELKKLIEMVSEIE